MLLLLVGIENLSFGALKIEFFRGQHAFDSPLSPPLLCSFLWMLLAAHMHGNSGARKSNKRLTTAPFSSRTNNRSTNKTFLICISITRGSDLTTGLPDMEKRVGFNCQEEILISILGNYSRTFENTRRLHGNFMFFVQKELFESFDLKLASTCPNQE